MLLLCLILAGSLSPLLANLTLGIIRKQNVWRSDLSNKVLVRNVVISFLSEFFDPEKLCPQMDEYLDTPVTIYGLERGKEGIIISSALKASLQKRDSSFLSIHTGNLYLVHINVAIS